MKFTNGMLGAAAIAAALSLASPVLAQDFVIDGEAAALYMTRSDRDSNSNILVTQGATTVFDNGSVDLSWELGAEGRLGIRQGVFGAEVGGFFLGEQNESARFTGTGAALAIQTVLPGGGGVTAYGLGAGDTLDAIYKSRLRGGHVAFTYTPDPLVTLFIGPRMLRLSESFQLLGSTGGGVFEADTWRSRNKMLGGTAGVRTNVFEVLGVDMFGLTLDGDVAVSMLRNKIDVNRQTRLGAGISRVGADSSTDWTVGFDLGLDLGYEVAQGVKVFAGYNLMYIRDVAKAVDQLRSSGNYNGAGAVPMRVATDDVLYHGFRAGIKVCLGCREQAEPVPAPVAEAPAPAPVPEPARNYLVFFDWDSVVLTQQSLDIISEAASAAKAEGNVKIDVTGHADKSGSDDYNLGLSRRRAEVVIAELERQGVPASEIAAFAKGESDPLVPTADGVREPQNRRVQIVLN